MSAPKGNQNALGNEGGRPPIHTDPLEVERLVKDYFKWIEGEFEMVDIPIEDEHGNIKIEKHKQWIRNPEPPTVTGLSLHLGFSSKNTLYEYSKKVEFSDFIKTGITHIEKYHEIKVSYGDKCVGNIFVLKNFGWKDTQEFDLKNNGESFHPSGDYENWVNSIKPNAE